MIDCVYIGDSIAVGLQQLDRHCAVYAKVGANTNFITKHYFGKGGQSYTVISMGSNWPDNPHNRQNAINLRNSIHSDIVIWIVPYDRGVASVIRGVAMEFKDSYMDLKAIPSKDHVHPNFKTAHKILDQVIGDVYD